MRRRSANDVQLHARQPGAAHERGRGAAQARRQAVRDRVLQEQGRELAERRRGRPGRGAADRLGVRERVARRAGQACRPRELFRHIGQGGGVQVHPEEGPAPGLRQGTPGC